LHHEAYRKKETTGFSMALIQTLTLGPGGSKKDFALLVHRTKKDLHPFINIFVDTL
jgi:hypothetical protein